MLATKVSPYRTISGQGGVVRKDISGSRHPTYNQWKQSWNGNRFPPPPVACDLYLPGYPYVGTSLRDFSGNNNHGTITGATWRKRPSGLMELYFDGNDDVDITGAFTNVLSSRTTGTILMWYKPDDGTPAASTYPFFFGDTDAATYLGCYNLTTGKMQIGSGLAGADQFTLITDNAVFSDGVAAFIGVTQNGTAPVLYVNGAAPAQTFTQQIDKTKWLNMAGLDNGYIGIRNIGGGGKSASIVGKSSFFLSTSAVLTTAQIKFIYDSTRHFYGV